MLIYQKNLAKGKFVNYDDVFAEIQLIWDNCKSYNMAGSEIYKLAEYMEKLTKRTIQKFRSQLGIQLMPPPAPSKLPILKNAQRKLVAEAKIAKGEKKMMLVTINQTMRRKRKQLGKLKSK